VGIIVAGLIKIVPMASRIFNKQQQLTILHQNATGTNQDRLQEPGINYTYSNTLSISPEIINKFFESFTNFFK